MRTCLPLSGGWLIGFRRSHRSSVSNPRRLGADPAARLHHRQLLLQATRPNNSRKRPHKPNNQTNKKTPHKPNNQTNNKKTPHKPNNQTTNKTRHKPHNQTTNKTPHNPHNQTTNKTRQAQQSDEEEHAS